MKNNTEIQEIQVGAEIIRGKTKKISELQGDRTRVIVESFDTITAGDGAKKNQIEGKAKLATQTTCNVFRLLESNNIPVAFLSRIDETRFLAERCRMIPLEVVVRRVALGSFIERNSEVQRGTVMEQLVVELYLKTNNRRFQEITIPECDDPYALLDDTGETFLLFNPEKEIVPQNVICTILSHLVLPGLPDVKTDIERIAIKTFEVLEEAWKNLGYTLADFKIEFGFSARDALLLADVIDNDSWRVIDSKGEHLDKQVYRDGAPLETVKGMYSQVAQLSKRFVDSE